MRRTLAISDVITLVLTHGEVGYQPVLDSLGDTKQFTVVTYNISPRDSELLRIVDKLDGTVEVRIITNIPARYGRYYGDAPRAKARQTINGYLQSLNPSAFTTRMQTFFNFDNHCKLVATDTIAYIGSANFSDESSDKWEAGFLIVGRELVRNVVDVIFNEVKIDAIEHGNNPVADAIVRLRAARAQITKLATDVHELFYTESDPDYGRSVEYFNSDECQATRSDLDAFGDILDEVEDVLGNLTESEPVSRAMGEIDLTPIERARSLLIVDEAIDDFVGHDPQQFMMAHVEGTLYDDYDEACQDAADEELDERQRLAEIAEPEVERVQAAFVALTAEVDRIEGVLRQVRLPDGKIDNT